MKDINIGCSGFSYKHWKNVFYPEGLPESGWLAYYSSIFPTVELNVTFYHLPSIATFRSWYNETPPDFVFAVKGNRYITHLRRLVDVREPLQRFFDAASELREKLSVVLWQFPPAFRLDQGRLDSFLSQLSRYPVRHTLEFRHESWIVPAIFNACREHGICLCMADSPPYIDDLPATADFVYVRRHGSTARYSGRYSHPQISGDAKRIRAWRSEGKRVFLYFNNDAFGYAPRNAAELMNLTGTASALDVLKKPA